MVKGWDLAEVWKFGADEGMSWSFNKSSDAPWQNGCSEALIKTVKRLMNLSIGNNTLTFSELQSVLFQIANLINERPIGIKPGCNLDMGTYLSPNDLLLGRTSNKVAWGSWDHSPNHRKRLEFMQSIVSSFWKKWMRDYFPTLLVREKWHVDRRNLKVNDIVLVQDSNVVRGTWKLAQVVTAEVGRDGKVRDVAIRYKPQRPGIEYKGQSDIVTKRSAHRLVVLLPAEEQEC